MMPVSSFSLQLISDIVKHLNSTKPKLLRLTSLVCLWGFWVLPLRRHLQCLKHWCSTKQNYKQCLFLSVINLQYFWLIGNLSSSLSQLRIKTLLAVICKSEIFTYSFGNGSCWLKSPVCFLHNEVLSEAEQLIRIWKLGGFPLSASALGGVLKAPKICALPWVL